MDDFDEYQYYYKYIGGEDWYGPFRKVNALKSSTKTSYGSRDWDTGKYKVEKGIVIKRAKVVIDDSWQEEWYG